MSRAFWFWLLWILWFLSYVFGVRVFGEYALYASAGLLLILIGLLGWKVFGGPVKAD